VVRVKQWDTIEHITDFDSAADHVRTRQKFEELNIPILKGMGQFANTNLTSLQPKSAFEEDADTTSYEVEAGLDGDGIYLKALKEYVQSTPIANKGAKAEDGPKQYVPPSIPEHLKSRENKRWKHDGPWLPGMSANDFAVYLSKQLSNRRGQFNKYLVEHVKAKIYAGRRKASVEKEQIPLDPIEAEKFREEQEKKWTDITPADIDAGIRRLRAECAVDPLNSDLVKNLIVPFLRLPPIKLKHTTYSTDSKFEVDSKRFSDETTPSSTHPSAGLGYLRTKAYLTNHPILGPQALPGPITARVIQPRSTATSKLASARLGVAGFVADDEHRNAQTINFKNPSANAKDLLVLDIDTPGGAKVPVQPSFAAVSPDGKVHIKTHRSYGAELAVSRGQLDERPPERQNSDVDPLASLNLGSSGVAELDAQTKQSEEKNRQRIDQFMKVMQKNGHKPKGQL
jgi:hypothetical protein